APTSRSADVTQRCHPALMGANQAGPQMLRKSHPAAMKPIETAAYGAVLFAAVFLATVLLAAVDLWVGRVGEPRRALSRRGSGHLAALDMRNSAGVFAGLARHRQLGS
ncbi:MAG: hypothetical protein KC492_25910, partial [Myxococcales bacterium]|nr:hypothetical protein [Myxococcales bacterium]